MRAGATHMVSERDRSAAEAAAAQLGRRVVGVHARGETASVALGFADGYEPSPGDGVFEVRRLSPAQAQRGWRVPRAAIRQPTTPVDDAASDELTAPLPTHQLCGLLDARH